MSAYPQKTAVKHSGLQFQNIIYVYESNTI